MGMSSSGRVSSPQMEHNDESVSTPPEEVRTGHSMVSFDTNKHVDRGHHASCLSCPKQALLRQ
eukprot:CAMPEP_0114323324 /NCGR_PEP_ID=MMETSP0059-20121206/27797_1 /TAXON_ID=36894 /ORGANISM="Pyramimonas parkeae, Strain CCMP726" /LENGTH=62 /DNA_ID=CAMNT_0001451557 /DNA_START=767 /DNA_END=955 /DNA_ORIENTATION=-